VHITAYYSVPDRETLAVCIALLRNCQMVAVVHTITILTSFVAGSAHMVPKETELPAVTSMMNASSSTLGKISRHVAKISTHMNELISAQKEELASQRTDFEKQLKLQSDINAKLEAQNEKISTEIWELEKSNENMRAEAKSLQTQNAKLRKAFTTVEAKAGSVDQFATKVLLSTDDKGSAELAVLNQKEDKDSDGDQDNDTSNQEKKDGDTDQDADVASSKEDDSAPANDESDSASAKDGESDSAAVNATGNEDSDPSSFLGLSMKTTRMRDDNDDNSNDQQDSSSEDTQAPEQSSRNVSSDVSYSDPSPADHKSIDMVAELKKEINQLSKQQDSSKTELTKLFQARFKKGADKKAQILEKQKLLDSTKASLTKLHTELQVALKHLKGTKTKLENQLHGLGHYLAKLASYLDKPAADAEKALPSLPSDVLMFLQSKA